jgi:hypothetical protein
MKTKLIIFLLAALIAGSCKKDKDSDPVPRNKFYVIAKINGTSWFNMQTDKPNGYESGNAYFASIWGGIMGDDVTIGINFDEQDLYYDNIDSIVNSLKGKTLPFDSTGVHSATLTLRIDGKELSSQYAKNQAGSFYISDVTSEKAILATDYFLKGTFNCTLDNEDNTNEKQLTEGKFCMWISSFVF